MKPGITAYFWGEFVHETVAEFVQIQIKITKNNVFTIAPLC